MTWQPRRLPETNARLADAARYGREHGPDFRLRGAGSRGTGRCDAGSRLGGCPCPRDHQWAVREFAYKDQVGESAANQISVAPLIALLGLYFWILQRRWPLATTRDALSVGAIWVSVVGALRVRLRPLRRGRFLDGPVRDLRRTAGNIWILILALDRRRSRDRSGRRDHAIGVAPLAARCNRRRGRLTRCTVRRRRVRSSKQSDRARRG